MSIVLDGDVYLIHTVHTAPGAIRIGESRWPKSRLWILEDRTVVAVVLEDGEAVTKNLGKANSVQRTSRKDLVIETDADIHPRVLFREASCSCGMGPIGSAGPIAGRWKLVRVRVPDWFQER